MRLYAGVSGRGRVYTGVGTSISSRRRQRGSSSAAQPTATAFVRQARTPCAEPREVTEEVLCQTCQKSSVTEDLWRCPKCHSPNLVIFARIQLGLRIYLFPVGGGWNSKEAAMRKSSKLALMQDARERGCAAEAASLLADCI